MWKTTDGKDFLRELYYIDIYNIFNVIHCENLLGRFIDLLMRSAIICGVTSLMSAK